MFKRLVLKRERKKIKASYLFKSLKWSKDRFKKISKLKQLLGFLDKRERFAIQTLLLTLGVFTTQIIWQDISFNIVFILSAFSYLLTFWSLKEDIKGIEKLLLFILPVFFTASVSLFYFLLPPRWIIRLTTTLIFAVGTYAILLIENIYNVASLRSIQLLRAAQSVGLLITLAVIFLSSNIIYSLRTNFIINFILIFLISFFLALQSLWSINLEKSIKSRLLLFSLLVGLALGELSLSLSFWPIQNVSFSLLMAATFYAMISIVQQYFLERLFFNLIREYIIVFIFTFILMFLTTKWG